MATLTPFCGLRYDPTIVGDLTAVVAPPYDVIDDAARGQLYARSDFNAVRIDLSAATDPYADAASTLGRWRQSGALVRDAAPAVYLYAQRFPMPDGNARERIGAIVALRLDRSEILRHEKTRQHAKADRLRLTEACRATLSPIMGLVSDPDWTFASITPARDADLDVVDEGGIRHRVWCITDPAVIGAVRARVAKRHVFIADGHHRYETALNYQAQARAALGGAAPAPGAASYDYIMAYLTTLEDPGLVVFPTHRVLPRIAVSAADLRRTLAQWFRVEDVPWSEANIAAASRWVETEAATPGTIRLVVGMAGSPAFWRLTAPAAELPFAAETPSELRALDVTALHRVIFERALGLTLDDRGGSDEIRYVQDACAALAAAERGEVQGVFLLPPTDLTAIRDVSEAGLTMPAKSTFFHPKLLTGLVFYPMDDAEPANIAADCQP